MARCSYSKDRLMGRSFTGCPSCIGAQDSLQEGKKRVIELLRILNQSNAKLKRGLKE
jgi:hypothetical protein